MANEGLKHVVHRRVHLERSQPHDRRGRVGQFLEKKADYKKRAKRYHVRENIIKDLAAKARFKNEDEFNFKMINGRLGEEGQVILETQDGANKRKFDRKTRFKYELANVDRNKFILTHKRNIVKNKVKKMLASNSALVASKDVSKHIIFDDDSKGKQVLAAGTEEELGHLSQTLDKERETDHLYHKYEDKRNVIAAQYAKRQIKRVRKHTCDGKLHEFVSQRFK